MLLIQKLHLDVQLPVRAWPDSSGLDVFAYLMTESGRPNKAIVPPNSTRLIPTGLVIKPPDGYTTLVCSRSGLAVRSIFVTNAPGVVDPDYRGEVKILLYNGSHESHYVQHGDRVAQLLLVATPHFDVQAVPELPDTARGESGFGSTGQ